MSVFEIIYLVSLVICLLGFFISSIINIPIYFIDCIFPVIPIINTICAILYILLFIGICFEVIYRKIYFIKTYRK